MILVTNSQHGSIVFEGDSDTDALEGYVELKDLPGVSHLSDIEGVWVLRDGQELKVYFIEDYLEVKLMSETSNK